MYKIVKREKTFNLLNKRTNNYVFEHWISKEYELQLYGTDVPRGYGFFNLSNRKNHNMLFTLTGEHIISCFYDYDVYDMYHPIVPRESDILPQVRMQDEMLDGINSYRAHKDHIALFANACHNNVNKNKTQSGFKPYADPDNRDNYFCFDYDGNLMFSTNAKNEKQGEQAFESYFSKSHNFN